MLTPQYLDELPRKLVGITAELEEDIAKDIARRIVKADYLTPTAKWQVYKAKQLRSSNGEIAQRIARYSGKTRKEIAKLFRDACFEALGPETEVYRRAGLDPPQFYRSETFDKLVKAGIKNNKGLMKNLTKTTAKTADRAFERLLDKAYFQNLSGAWSHQEIIAKTVRELASKGIQSIAYPSGHVDKADVAVRRALLTSVNQTSMQLSLAYADEMGCDLVETTAHGGARPDHARWQGQIFSRSGKSKKYPDFRRSTGYGTGAGLGGWNCRHSFMAYIEGSGRAYSEEYLKKLEEKTVSYNGKKYKEYEAVQLQRSFERRIRDAKRQAGVLDAAIKASGDQTLKEELQPEFERVSVRLKSREAALKDFLQQTGRLRDTSREQAVGFGRSTAQKAVWADRRAANSRLEEKLNWPKSALKRLRQDEKLISKGPNERAIIYNPNGSVAFIKNGGLDSVQFSPREIQKMKGCVLTHNHPYSTTFSPHDINMLRNGQLEEIRAAGKDGVFVLRNPGTWDSDFDNLEKIRRDYEKVMQAVEPIVGKRLDDGLITLVEYNQIFQMHVMDSLATRHHLDYYFESWD